MNYIDTLKSVDLVFRGFTRWSSEAGQPKRFNEDLRQKRLVLIVIDGNLLKEGEIGGLPTIEPYTRVNHKGEKVEKKSTIYAVHHKLWEIDEGRK